MNATRSNITWSMDFMADRLGDGRAFRLLNVLDDFNRLLKKCRSDSAAYQNPENPSRNGI
jgi:hypothetical protein